MKQPETNEIKVISKKLNDACFIDFGTRVVQKKDGGAIFPVYGGGGATFKMDSYNRENCLVVSRFAMSKQCTRFVEGKFYLNDSGLTVRPKNEKELSQEYLDYLLLTLNDTIYSLSRGTAQRNLNVPKFRKLEIKYPDSIELQLHIATLLSKAENLIAQRKESIRLLDEFLKSTFLEMFGNNTANDKGWNKISLVDGCENKKDVKCGPFGTQLSKSEYQENGIPVWGIPQINSEFRILPKEYLTEKKAFELDEYSVIPYDILMSRKGNVGKCSLFPKGFSKGIIHSDVLRIRTNNNKVHPVFLLFQLKYSKKIEMQIKGVTKGAIMAGINVGLLKHIIIDQPPLELQTQLAHIVEKTEVLKTQYQQSLQELENLYGSLSQKAFRGELKFSEASLLNQSK